MGEFPKVELPSENAPTELVTVEEGKAKLRLTGPVFYNPVQEFNRDLTVLVLREFVRSRATSTNVQCALSEPKTKKVKYVAENEDNSIRVLDALSASGLRALRFAKEVNNVGFVLANDFSEKAVQSIRDNILLNDVGERVIPNFGDAVETMMSHRYTNKRFHAVDLDPYGSASVFLDSAVQCVADNG
ncbi:N2,N2-dimethylguanosine tRNA methyltransferase [Dictyocaulus viviparus]|uniref:tRNA (guanine(26)-N(2))-dimethyltransferase n=1 Tax=Dictyocaulus viviparus TaxID=29172 RepID=A0A0D8XUD3_DICVI|nr:N2,N2-dimethylguanosine tRNA methyltransferase [Dictyocaulus viviparus]